MGKMTSRSVYCKQVNWTML